MFSIVDLRFDKIRFVWSTRERGKSELTHSFLPGADGTELICSRRSIKNKKAAVGAGGKALSSLYSALCLLQSLDGTVPGLEIRVCKSANVRRADKDMVPVGLSYVYAVDNRFIKDPDFQSEIGRAHV